MAKQNFNSGLEKSGPHRPGENGGKSGTIGKAGVSSGGEVGIRGGKRARNPVGERGKSNPEGKGSGDR